MDQRDGGRTKLKLLACSITPLFVDSGVWHTLVVERVYHFSSDTFALLIVTTRIGLEVSLTKETQQYSKSLVSHVRSWREAKSEGETEFLVQAGKL